jgi:uncharacterized protein DUF4062
MIVYLSSTLNDLGPERVAVKEVLTGEAIVKESYRANEGDLTESCREDVAGSDLYIGILGLRYGFIPPKETKSITHIEYEEATAKNVPRLIFVKAQEDIRYDDTDAAAGHPMDRIEHFRAQVSSGGPDDPRPAQFSTVDDLKLKILRAVSDYRTRKAGMRSLMTGGRVHRWEIKYDLSIACVPGTDDTLTDSIRACALTDQRTQVFELSPADPGYLQRLDDEVRKSRCVMLVVSPRSLSRLNDASATVAASLAIVSARRAARLAVMTAGVSAPGLTGSSVSAIHDVFETSEADWIPAARDATFANVRRWCREYASDAPAGGRIGVPYLTLALKESEAEDLRDRADALFAKFGDAAPLRRSGFDRLSKSLASLGIKWPEAFYGARRELWRPFGANNASIEEFVDKSARKVNAAPEGSRERRVLVDFKLVPHRYTFDEYLNDVNGSRDNVQRVCDSGCLVLVDEFALLHPELRPAIDALLASNNAAVVSLSACDPSPGPLRDLLGDLSYLRVGNLLSRFQQVEDVRCELALNSIERLQRWLRLVLPELMTTLAQQQGSPELINKVDELFVSGTRR